MHTEIIINYEKLDRAIWRLDSYLQSLDRVEGVINTNAKMLEDQKGEVFIALEENRTSIKSGIAEQREMSTALRDSLARYREEMEQLIHPIARGQDVRVSKLDIQNNLFSIGFALDGIFSPPVYAPEHQWNPYESWMPTGIGEGYIVQDTEKIERERRNGDKIDRFIDETLYDLKKRLQSCRENIEDIYYRNVVGFVEKDDEHARYVTQNIYSEYATEHEVRMDFETARAEAGADFFRGVWGGIKGMGEGIAALMKISAAADAISNSTMLGEELPEWAVKELEDFSSGFKDMKELSDFFEMIGQSQLNTYEKEGPGYIAGSAAFEGVTAAVPVSKIAAAIKAVRLARLADKGLDAVDTGSDLARGVGELADAGMGLKVGDKFEEIIDAMRVSARLKINASGLTRTKIDEILATGKGKRPDPASYLNVEYVEKHLSAFKDGVSKIMPEAPNPNRAIGQENTFCFPSSEVDKIIDIAGGDPRKIESLLGLPERYLEDNPVRIDIPNPKGLKMPSGNERGVNEQWIPGGYTEGGLKEAVIDPVVKGEYVVIELGGI